MLKRSILLLVALFTFAIAKAQTDEAVYNRYLDFNLARLQGETEKAMGLGQDIIPDVARLKPKTQISFYYSIGNLFENDSQSVKAIEYYEKVATAVPDYYVVHRALGYLYAKQSEEITDKLNPAYKAAVKKSLPHLEKAQACDPDNDTLKLIITLYNNIGDKQGVATLSTRLAAMSKSCIDLLDDK
jgi:tetratricopeptide (TPR) repeat protein